MRLRSSRQLSSPLVFAVAIGLAGCTKGGTSQAQLDDAPSDVAADEDAASAQAQGHGDGKHGDGKHGDDMHGKHGDDMHGKHGKHGEHGEHGEHAGADNDHRHHGGDHRFEDPEVWTKKFDSPERLAWQKPDDVVAKLKLDPAAVVTDLGAGTGTFTVRLAAAVPQGKVLANDVEASMIAYIDARAKKAGLTNVVPVQGEADDPKLPEDVDVAFICDVFHHIEDIPGFFGKVRERLRKDGRLVLVDFKKDAPEDAPGPPKAMRVRSEDAVKQLTQLGYHLQEVDTTTLEFQYILVFDRGGAPTGA